jgi:hypothetical protein
MWLVSRGSLVSSEQLVRSAAEEEEQGRRRPAVPVHLCSRAWPGGRRPVKRSTN